MGFAKIKILYEKMKYSLDFAHILFSFLSAAQHKGNDAFDGSFYCLVGALMQVTLRLKLKKMVKCVSIFFRFAILEKIYNNALQKYF